MTSPFRLGVFDGAAPGKWVDTWRERTRVPIELVPVDVERQREAIDAGEVDAALVRLPIDREGLHVIPLYDERTVVVVPVDSALTTADELEAADLEGEVLLVPADDVLKMPAPPGTVPAAEVPATTADAIAVVAAGVGVVLMPMSLARAHHRRDVAHRPLRDGPVSPVGLAWIAERTTPDVERFIGIVRGRTARSSR